MSNIRQEYRIGAEDKEERKDKNGEVRAVTCFFINENGQVLVQKRNKNLQRDPGKIDLCSGHIKEYQTPLQAMMQEAEEEYGLPREETVNARQMGEVVVNYKPEGRDITYHAFVYAQKIDKNRKFSPNEEVGSLQWIEFEDLIYLIKETKETRFPYASEYESIFQKIREQYIQQEFTQEDREMKER